MLTTRHLVPRTGRVNSSRSYFTETASSRRRLVGRDPAHLHEQALLALGIEETSMLVVSVGDPPHPSLRSGHARSVIIESPVPPTRAFFLY